MSKKLQSWLVFALRVRNHIRAYVIKQYGDDGQDPATEYTAEDCIKQAQRYLARFGKQSRQGEELLDLYKAAHWIQIAHDKLSSEPPVAIPYSEFEEAERNFANEPATINELRATKTRRGSDWTPRDVLASLLRDIDRGEISPEALVVSFRTKAEDGNTQSFFSQSTPDMHTALGLLEAAKFKIVLK